MRTIPVPPEAQDEDWSNANIQICEGYEEPYQVLEYVDRLLKGLGLEVVMLDEASDDHHFMILPREPALRPEPGPFSASQTGAMLGKTALREARPVSIPIPCPTCSATGDATFEDRHAGTNRDTCPTCGGTGTAQAQPGTSRETSWPYTGEGSAEELSRREAAARAERQRRYDEGVETFARLAASGPDVPEG